MRPAIQLAAGVAAGALIVREHRARDAAERLAAALLETLLNAIDATDPDTGAHVRRVARYTSILAEAADLDQRARHDAERVALFHDIGKIHEALFDIVHEPQELTPEERTAIATHPQRGADVLAPLEGFYPTLAAGVLSHHERWDGTGYPLGLKGGEIPLVARIVALADTFDAITHSRRYRAGRSALAAAEVLAEGRGTQFDPDLTDLFLSPPVLDEIAAAMQEVLHPQPEDHGNRRRGAVHDPGPDVKFRWREGAPERLGPAILRRRQRG